MQFGIPLSEIPRRLNERFGARISYRRAYLAVLDGRLPAEHVNGRWFVPEDRLDEVARTLGIEIPN